MAFVRIALVAAGVRDHQPGRQSQPSNELNGMFDAFAPHDTGGLQEEVLAVRDSQVGLDGGCVGIGFCRGSVEVHHVGDQACGNAAPVAQLRRRRRIDHNMPHVGQPRRKAHVQVVPDAVDQEPAPLPIEVMMVGNGLDAGFADEFGECQRQRDVERDGEGILNQQHVQIELLGEFVEVLLEVLGDVVDFPGERSRTYAVPEGDLIDLDDGSDAQSAPPEPRSLRWDRDRRAPQSRSTDAPIVTAPATTSRPPVIRRRWMPARVETTPMRRLLAGIA